MFDLKKFFVVLVAVLLVGCGGSVEEDDGKLKVVATVGMLGDAVKNIGGDLVEVKNLMGVGVDPHAYQPTAGDLRAMKEADVVFYVGLHLEGKMVEILETMKVEGKAVEVSDVLAKEGLIAVGDEIYDPHIWFDVELWVECVINVLDTLVAVDGENADVYRANAERYLSELWILNGTMRIMMEEIPVEKRVLVTAHDAFSYFGRAYGLEVKAIQGINTVQEYGVKDLEELVNFIVEREIPLVFMESSVSARSINALMEGVRGRGFEVAVGGELYSDAMGSAGTEEGTYLGMLRHNVEEISKLKN